MAQLRVFYFYNNYKIKIFRKNFQCPNIFGEGNAVGIASDRIKNYSNSYYNIFSFEKYRTHIAILTIYLQDYASSQKAKVLPLMHFSYTAIATHTNIYIHAHQSFFMNELSNGSKSKQSLHPAPSALAMCAF